MLIRLAGFLKYAKFAATFMLVISAVSCGGGSSESGSGGGSADADPTGSYYGTYEGTAVVAGNLRFSTIVGRLQEVRKTAMVRV